MWKVAVTPPDAGEPREWRPVEVPVERPLAPPAGEDADALDWWFRTTIPPTAAPADLVFDGVATAWEALLDGEPIAGGESMFLAERAPLPEGGGELSIRCRALAPLLADRRRPRARWRQRVAADGNLRWWRTSLLGRAPGFAPPPPLVGPWRAVRVEPRGAPRLTVRARCEGADGVVEARATGAATHVAAGGRTAALAGGAATLRIAEPARWWPHTHGEPALHDVVLLDGDREVDRRRVGFRELWPGTDEVVRDGLDLHVNGVRTFVRGALWTPVGDRELRATLTRVRDAGMNMVRVPGTMVYESDRFHDLCDELGLLVWQDFMFANLDYPIADEGFRALVRREADQVVERIGWRPSTAVWCGNSEVEQQVAMLGLDPALGRGELFGEVLPAAVAAGGGDAPYLPSAPCGDGLPFRPDRGVANYFGVGGYRRPLEDVRRAGVRFASECLAIANVPEDDPPSRTAGVPRDVGADWDFADVRDHYLALLFGDVEPERYYELSRAVSGEVMAEVFGEWRRAGSPCGGGLVLWLRDLLPGSGWGLLDAEGRPKPVWHRLRRALAPVAVWTTDEGLGGVVAHVANDGAEGLEATLRVTAYRDGAVPVGEGTEPLALPAHGAHSRDLEELLGHFADLSWAYRFGPPQQDAVAVAVERDGELLAHAMRFPVGFPRAATAEELGLEARVRADPPRLELRSTRVVAGVRIVGGDPREGVVDLEPGRERVVALGEAGAPTALHAVNLLGSVEL